MNIAVLIKQVPMVSELPWDKKTGELLRNRAEGMMNPACKHALEAALRLRQEHGGRIAAISMGPPMAEEVVREAMALGADDGYLICDPQLAGADTLATARTLAMAVKTVCPDFDLLLLGSQSTDSETGQVGPQLAELLNLPAVCYAGKITTDQKHLRVERAWDKRLETVEMGLPALITVAASVYSPRYLALAGVERAFTDCEVKVMDARAIGVDPSTVGRDGSASRIVRIYSPTAEKKGMILSGAPKKCVQDLLSGYADRLGGLVGKDLGETS